jgi:hypothetical protein
VDNQVVFIRKSARDVVAGICASIWGKHSANWLRRRLANFRRHYLQSQEEEDFR